MMFHALMTYLVVIVFVAGRPSVLVLRNTDGSLKDETACDCGDEYDPWCGDEGTYSNLCQLECAGDEIEGHDTCENIEKCLDNLPDINDGPEVCAEHGITFDSIQEMKCHKLCLVHNGECEN